MIFKLEQYFHTSQRIFSLYQIYRFCLSCLLIAIVTYGLDKTLLPTANRPLLYMVCWIYFIGNIISLLLPIAQRASLILFLLLADIIALSTLFFAAGGPSSGLANLLIITIIIGNTLFRGKVGYLIATICTICIITVTAALSFKYTLTFSQYTQIGTLGGLCFICAALIQNLMMRMQASEIIAKQKTKDAINLQILNNLIVEQMPSGVLLIDKKGKIIMANNEAHRLLDEPILEETFVNHTFPDLDRAIKQWLTNPRLEIRPLHPLKQNTSLLRPTLTHSKHSEQLVILVFLESLDTINKQIQQVKLASLGNLTASIAHEIRNPLGALSHAIQLLKESENMDEQDLHLLQIVMKNSSRINTIISDILQLSKKKQPLDHNTTKPLELSSWLENYIAEFTETHQNPSDHLNINIATKPIYTYIIPSQLHQIVTNLVNNALFHTKRHNDIAHIWLALYTNPITRLPQLDVLDNGNGVPTESIDKLFEPFFTTSNKGTGLGLFITKELCENNQAQLQYLPRSEGGSCFRVIFPSANPLF